jgi:predicted nucleic acid-binding protein
VAAVARYLADKSALSRLPTPTVAARLEPLLESGLVARRRALEVQTLLAAAGQLRSVPIPDLLVAATAERHGVTALHYDEDYERIAALTAQPTEWVVPRGSVS